VKRYLIDANLPRGIAEWQGERFLHVVDIDDEWTDTQIWDYARKNDHTIVTKDSDFSHRIIVSKPPPKIIHLRIGNMRLREFIRFVGENWTTIENASKRHKLVNVYRNRVETIS
jgi:predicted nuclease of predicted toxin-antitoxin system